MQGYDRKTGGAQYILKGIDYTFWEDVERMCVEIRKKFYYNILGSVNNKYFKSENAGFQSWCADMWAVNFSLWKRGIQTDVTPLLDFSWATDNWETYTKKPIYHNAGALNMHGNLFRKAKWIEESPIGKSLGLPPKDSANRAYVLAIQEVK